METEITHQIISQFIYIIKKRKWLVLICVLGVLVPIVFYNETVQPTYQAFVSIIFEDISNPLHDNNNNYGRMVYQEKLILNRTEEIKSRAIAAEIAAAMPVELLKRFELPENFSSNADRDKFLTAQIRGSISVQAIRKTDVISITAESPDPLLSMTIANTAADILRKRNVDIKKNEVSSVRKFIEEQLMVFQRQLKDSEQKLRDFKIQNRVTSLQKESEEILRRITAAEVAHNQVRSQRKSTEERLKFIRNKLSRQRLELVASITNTRSPKLRKLKERLVDLQVQHTQLQVRDYQDDHPKMVKLKSEIEQTKKSLTEAALKLADIGVVVDPLSQMHAYITETFSLEIEVETLRSQERALKNILNEYGETLKKLPDKELELASLVRTKEVNEKLLLMLMEKNEEARISEAEKIGDIRVIDFAQLPGSPTKPRKKPNLAIGLIVGLLVGFGLAFLLEFINKTVRNAEEVEQLTSWPVLAVIPEIDLSKNGKFIHEINSANIPEEQEPDAQRGMLSMLHPSAMAAEAFRVLRTNLQFLNNQEESKSVLITSINAGDGKSTTSTNLGITLAKLGLKVLIVDCDLRRPTIHKLLKVEREPGLSDILLNHHTIVSDLIAEDLEKEFYDKNMESPVWTSIQNLRGHKKDVDHLEENFRELSTDLSETNKQQIQLSSQYRNLLITSLIESVQGTQVKGLKVLTSGKSVENPSEILSTASLRLLLEEVGKKFDVVLIDSPPLLLVPDSMILSAFVDEVLVVMQSGKNQKDMVLNVKKFLDKTDTRVLGVVLNKVDPKMIYKDKDYYYYG